MISSCLVTFGILEETRIPLLQGSKGRPPLSGCGVSPLFSFSPACRLRRHVEKRRVWGHPTPRQGGFAPCTPKKSTGERQGPLPGLLHLLYTTIDAVKISSPKVCPVAGSTVPSSRPSVQMGWMLPPK